MGDFNMEPDKSNIKTFMENHDLYNLIESKTCFKSPTGKCILTNFIHSNKQNDCELW